MKAFALPLSLVVLVAVTALVLPYAVELGADVLLAVIGAVAPDKDGLRR